MPRRESYARLDDLVLFRGIERRDACAMQALFDRHARAVLATCLSVLGNHCDAEDVLEAVFFGLWQHPERFDDTRGGLRAYLELTARSRSLDLLRARSRATKRERTAHSLGNLEGTHPEPLAPLSDVLHRERRQRVQKAVDALEAGQRRVIELAFFEGMTHSQVADRLDLPLGTVKSRMRAGLQLLRRRLTARDAAMGGGDS